MASSPILSDFVSSDNPLVSVQELAKNPLITVPQQYVRFDGGQPTTALFDNTYSFPKIPTIDMNNLVMAGEIGDLELEKLHSSCKDWGIFQLVNGVRPSLLEKVKHEVEEFFKLPLEEKMKYKIRPGEVEGYGTITRTDNQKVDWSDRVFMILNPVTRRKPYLFSELPSSLRTTLESYFMDLQKLAMRLFGLLGKALKLDQDVLMKDLFEDGMQSVRMTYYPPCPQPELVVGISPHSDVSGITILNQLNGVSGLQINKDGVWLPVEFLHQDALMVNVGDILEIMSNGAYKSIEHKVIPNSSKERISLAVFFNPKYEEEIGPLSNLVNPQNPPLFKRIGMEKYVHDFFSRRKLDGKTFLEQMRIKNGENTDNLIITS